MAATISIVYILDCWFAIASASVLLGSLIPIPINIRIIDPMILGAYFPVSASTALQSVVHLAMII
jgi:hypothetical protein